MSAHGLGLHRTPLGDVLEELAWSRDGRRLAFVRGDLIYPPVGLQPDIFSVSYDGSDLRRLTDSPQDEVANAWRPDGRALLFTSGRSLWRVSRDGGTPRRLVSNLIIASATWSPDGRQIALGAVTFSGDRRFHLYTLPATGGRPRPLTGEIATGPPAWSPDGQLIAFVDAEKAGIDTIAPDGSGRRTVAELPGADINDLTWSPDGRHLAFTAAKSHPSD